MLDLAWQALLPCSSYVNLLSLRSSERWCSCWRCACSRYCQNTSSTTTQMLKVDSAIYCVRTDGIEVLCKYECHHFKKTYWMKSMFFSFQMTLWPTCDITQGDWKINLVRARVFFSINWFKSGSNPAWSSLPYCLHTVFLPRRSCRPVRLIQFSIKMSSTQNKCTVTYIFLFPVCCCCC